MHKSTYLNSSLKKSRGVILGVFTLLLLLALLPVQAIAQVNFSDTARKINTILQPWTHPNLPGVSIAISRNGQLLYAAAMGAADLEHCISNDTSTIFEAGSVSKQFTAAAILLLEQDGKLSQKDDVREYVPELPVYESAITIYDLIHHQSGLRDWGSVAAVEGWERGSRAHTNAHALQIICRQKALNNPPGTEYICSNSNYNLMAIIVERVAKTSFAEFCSWHATKKICYWVDILGKEMYALNWMDQRLFRHQFSEMVSLIIPGSEENLILGMKGGIYRYTTTTGQLVCLTDLGINWKNHRCNDGIADSHGRLWVGTMGLDFQTGAGNVYKIDQQYVVEKKIEEVTISNGMAWSPDNTRLYYIDSASSMIRSYYHEPEKGRIRFEKIAVTIPKEKGLPDGMAVDAEGMLWVALWGGFGVARYNPITGNQIGLIELPVPQVSSCCFAGEDLDHLIITTAREGMTENELNKYPLSGQVFHVLPGVIGQPVFTCSI